MPGQKTNDWLGEVPDHWGLAPSWSLYRRVKRTGHETEELLSVYRDHGVVPKSSRDDNHNVESEDLSGYQLVKVGDLVMNKMKAWQGSIALSDHQGIVSPAYFVFQPLHNGHLKYFHYLLRSEKYIGAYNRISKGVRVGQWDLDPVYFRTLPIPVPPLDEQKAIADFLDRELALLDHLIYKQELLIELLQQRRFAAIQNAFAAARNLQGSVAAPLKWHAKFRTGGTPTGADFKHKTDAGVPWLRPDDLDESGEPSQGTRFFNMLDLGGIALAKPGAVLICCIGATLGKAGIVNEVVSFNQQITSLTSVLNSKFLFYQIVASKQELKKLSMGNTLPILNNDRLGTLQIVVPPKAIQAEIADQLDLHTSIVDRATEKSLQLISVLSERRSALIDAAVTGKIDLRGTN
jgi:type I restriction enzyme, S subunit